MRKRIISALVGLGLLAVILFFYDTYVFNLAVGIISVVAVYELLVATKYVENRALSFTSLAFSVTIPFFRTPSFNDLSRVLCFLFVLVLLMILFVKRDSVKIEQIGFIFFISLVVPLALSAIIFIRNEFTEQGRLFVMLALGGAWFADSGAYFIGRFWGKHPLAPSISPHKTIEGAIGGLIAGIIGCCALCAVYATIYNANYPSEAITVNYPLLCVLAVLLAIAGMVGDLIASIIKRQCAIKDFGSIMPGHGGVLDRFDSVCFTSSLLYILLPSVCGMLITPL